MDANSIASRLQALHWKIKREWVDQCLEFVKKQFSPRTAAEALEKVTQQLLHTDLDAIGTPSLPTDIASRHDEFLTGPFMLQIVEIVNISEPLEKRYQDTKNRTLKLALSDGVQPAYALEHKFIKDLSLNTLPGSKVQISNVKIRHGMMWLHPENVKFLGGGVSVLIELGLGARKACERTLMPKEFFDDEDIPQLDPLTFIRQPPPNLQQSSQQQQQQNVLQQTSTPKLQHNQSSSQSTPALKLSGSVPLAKTPTISLANSQPSDSSFKTPVLKPTLRTPLLLAKPNTSSTLSTPATMGTNNTSISTKQAPKKKPNIELDTDSDVDDFENFTTPTAPPSKAKKKPSITLDDDDSDGFDYPFDGQDSPDMPDLRNKALIDAVASEIDSLTGAESTSKSLAPTQNTTTTTTTTVPRTISSSGLKLPLSLSPNTSPNSKSTTTTATTTTTTTGLPKLSLKPQLKTSLKPVTPLIKLPPLKINNNNNNTNNNNDRDIPPISTDIQSEPASIEFTDADFEEDQNDTVSDSMFVTPRTNKRKANLQKKKDFDADNVDDSLPIQSPATKTLATSLSSLKRGRSSFENEQQVLEEQQEEVEMQLTKRRKLSQLNEDPDFFTPLSQAFDQMEEENKKRSQEKEEEQEETNTVANRKPSQSNMFADLANIELEIDDQSLGFENEFSLTGPEDAQKEEEEDVGPPFMYLSDETTEEIVRVKGCVRSTVRHTFGVINNEYTLKVRIEDGLTNKEVTLSSSVIESVVGFSPQHFEELRSNQSPEIQKVMSDISAKLPQVEGAFLIRDLNTNPVVVAVEEDSAKLIRQLFTRLGR